MTKEFVTERLKLIDIYPDKAKSVAKEYGLKEDEVELIRKGRISTEPVIDRDARTVINYISTDAIDRDNEVIEHRGVVLDDYKKNPIVPWAHDYRALPIGKNLWIKPDKKGLVAKTYFAKHPFAEEVFDLYTEDIKGTGPVLKAWSVGFVPLKWKDAKNGDKDAPQDERPQTVRRTYKKWLLLEYSAVPVPCNPEALTLMVEKGLIKSKKLIKDIEDFIVETKEENKIINKEDLIGGENTPDYITVGDLTEEETGTPYLYTNGDGTLVTQEEILEEWIEKGAITKPEETDELIRLPAKGEEGKHKGHKIRWITVSAEKGIRGIYCIDCKKIITYVFEKAKGWTMAKAQKWMKDNGKQVEDLIALWNHNMPDEKDDYLKELFEWYLEGKPRKKEKKGVIPFTETSKAPEGEKWDAGREVRQAEISDLKVMSTWFNSEEPDVKGSYKLPHHKADGHAVVWRAVAAAMAALLGARGGVQIPEKDRKGVYNHLVKSYKQFDKEPPELREYTEEEFEYINDGIDHTSVSIGIYEKFEDTALEQYWQDTIRALQEEPETEDPIKWIKELTEEVREINKGEKEGRVLSGKNLKLVKDCREQIKVTGELLDKLIVASEPPKEESILSLIEESKANGDNIEGLKKEDIPILVEEVLNGIKEGMTSQRKQIQKTLDDKLGKVS